MIASGHPPDIAWGYTPLQADAFARLASKRKKREFSLAVLAARGKPEAIETTFLKWRDD